jgi:universal stress protein A
MKAKPTKHSGEVVLELSRRDEPMMAAASKGTAASPFRLKKILVPIDFSDCAKKALQYAIPFAQQHEAALTLLYVVPTNFAAGEYGAIDYASLEAQMRTDGDKQLATLIAEEVRSKVTANALIRSGSPAVEIIEVARKLPADLIIISTHGRTGFKHVLLGSIAEDVIRRAPCPVLVVREHEHEFVS